MGRSELKTSNAETIGLWEWTWSKGSIPPNRTLSIAFSGWTDVTNALADSSGKLNELVGTKFISFGGGNSSGSFQKESIDLITQAIQDGKLSAYDGIAYDVEEGDSGLADAFSESFKEAKKQGMSVLVTVSHSAPYGIQDAADLMNSFFDNDNIDYLSPQLYTTGEETENNYDTSHGVEWNQYACSQAKVVPSIVSDDMYENAKQTFKDYGVNLSGYIRWSQT